MNAVITFFPVDNGDMTLIQLESGRSILIDVNIRDPSKEEVRDVLTDLQKRLRKDDDGRYYVDAMLLSHPDQDHCRGLKEYFHLGSLSDYVEPEKDENGKIVICEMWSSPMVFRRTPKDETRCDDADAWCTEARRRAKLFKESKLAERGDRIQIMGEDEDGKTDGLTAVMVKAGQTITKIDGQVDDTFSGFLIAPEGKGDAADEERRSKNHSSVIVRFSIANGDTKGATKFLTGGDALVGIWDRVWADYKKNRGVLEYHILEAPHHCSWHTLSEESWSDSKGKATASPDARKALGQALNAAYVVASSEPIKDDDNDPPCIGAKREYEDILSGVEGSFVNTAKHTVKGEAVPMEFEVCVTGPVLQEAGSELGVDAATSALSAAALKRAADSRPPVVKQGERRFA